MSTDMRERVERGAAWMDTVRPGWETEIAVERLAFWSMTNCILGQTFGFQGGSQLLPERGSVGLAHLGFALTTPEMGSGAEVTVARNQVLRDMWIDQILAREMQSITTPTKENARVR